MKAIRQHQLPYVPRGTYEAAPELESIELTAENVASDFGTDSRIAREAIYALWNHLESSLTSGANRAEMLFGEWQVLFGQSTNLSRMGQARLGKYFDTIGIPTFADPTHALFVLHTYHALFFKLLAAEVMLANRSVFGAGSEYCFGAATLDDAQFIEFLERDIEGSALFQQAQVRNFVDVSNFSWYLVHPPKDLIDAIRHLMQRLKLYRLNGLQLRRTRDIVKRVYQQLVPASLRHHIGEYFTPEWLVEFTLDGVDYSGTDILDRKFLDPCCGSGNFVIHAIDRYKAQARSAGWDNAWTLKQITGHIFGFDLNPLAVLTARVNYLLAISDLIDTTAEIEIPIYQTDAIADPVQNLASVAIGPCQYIASNPPWVRWSELPQAYRRRIAPTCRTYDIFSEETFFGGNELDISAMITYTVADKWLDADGGRLSFVLTQTLLQSQSSGGFRRFAVNGMSLQVRLVDDFVAVRPFSGIGNKPAVIHIQKGQPTTYPIEYRIWNRSSSASIPEEATWAGASKQLYFEKMEANALSGSGMRWCILPPAQFQNLSVLDGRDLRIEGRKGIMTDLNGAYFVELLGPGRFPNTVRIRNHPESGRHPLPSMQGDVELDLVYPLIKGATNIRAFYATVSPLFALIPNIGITTNEIPLVSEFARNYPGALQYFQAINGQSANTGLGLLDARSTWRSRMLPQFEKRVREGKMAAEDIPFYAVYDIGAYTFAPFKVVWAEMAGTLRAAVIAEAEVPFGGGMRPVVPDHKVYFAAFDEAGEAHYVCALLNSEPVRTFIDGFTIKLQVGTLFKHIELPAYHAGNPNHRQMARYSQEAHAILAATGGKGSIADLQSPIDELTIHIIAD